MYISKKSISIKCDEDIGINYLKLHKINSNLDTLKIYLKFNLINYNLIYNWTKNKNNTIHGLIDEFNTCSSYITLSRISNI